METHPENEALRRQLRAIQAEVAGLRVELGIREGVPPSGPAAGSSADSGRDSGAVLQRSFSSATYDKMLSNPKLDAEQRKKILAMKERRAAKEVALETTMTDLVRTASPATQAALREAMAGLEEARREAGFGAQSPSPSPQEAAAVDAKKYSCDYKCGYLGTYEDVERSLSLSLSLSLY
jgi:hypothetical protein